MMSEPKLTKAEWKKVFDDLNILSAAGKQNMIDDYIDCSFEEAAGYDGEERVTYLEAALSRYRVKCQVEDSF